MLLKYLGFCGLKNASSSKKYYPTVIEELCHQFSLEDLKKSTNNFDKKLVIGGFGTLYKGCLKHNGTTDYTIALKRFHWPSCQCVHDEFVTEIELLCQLRHPNLVALVGFCNQEMEKIIVYEYMPNRSLHDRLNSKEMEPLSWKKRIEICIGLARGVHYLHTGAKRLIIHRDIKPMNILLDNNMVPKLSNFGLSVQGPLSTSKPKPIVDVLTAGTLGYLAPECLETGNITDKCDVYSFGVVLVRVVCTKEGQTYINKANMQPNQEGSKSAIANEYLEGLVYDPPYPWSIEAFLRQFPIEEVIDPILEGKIAPECWEVFMDITKRCLKRQPDERPTIGEVEVLLEHALSLQEEADIGKTDGDYALLSTTMIFEPSICRGDQ